MSVAIVDQSSQFEVQNCTDFLKASTPDRRSRRSIPVDRKTNTINGYVVAELGPFKSEGRGEFNLESLKKIVELGNSSETGLKNRFAHPSLSGDGVGTFLGRADNFRLEGGKMVRADMHLDPTALKTPPNGGRPYGEYVMELAETDPAAFATSLVVKVNRKYRLNDDGTRKMNEEGIQLPPIWDPTELHASDVVDTGDAVNSFLSVGGDVSTLRDEHIFQAHEVLNRLFEGKPRDVVRSRLLGFVDSYCETLSAPEEDDMSDTQALELAKKNADSIKTLRSEFLDQGKSIAEQLTGIADSIKKDREDRESSDLAVARSKKIQALCHRAGIDKKRTDELIDGKLSTGDVAELCTELLAQKQELAGDGGTNNGDASDKETKHRSEYKEHLHHHQQMEVTVEEYIAQRKLEDEELSAADPGAADFKRVEDIHKAALSKNNGVGSGLTEGLSGGAKAALETVSAARLGGY